MPTQTFFNLAEEKRLRLLQAAKDEFSRVPFEEASINRIIQAASISRGSFYMYFADKEDLLYYLSENLHNSFKSMLESSLSLAGGDLFGMVRIFYRKAVELYQDENLAAIFRNSFHYLVKKDTESGNFAFDKQQRSWLIYFRHIMPLIHTQNLNLQNEGDLEAMVMILGQVVQQSIAPLLFSSIEPAQLIEQFEQRLSILARGMAKTTPGTLTK